MSNQIASRRKKVSRALIVATATAAIALTANVSRAIDIILQYDGAGVSQNPSFDPQAIGLTIALQQVEAMFEDIVNDPYTLTLHYRWVSEPTLGTLADHQLMVKQNGREIEGQLRFYSANANPFEPRRWFIDMTPSDHSEYNMQQTLWRDLTPEEKTGRYTFGANIPETFEAAYYGRTTPNPPPDEAAYDLLSVAAHEVGHAMGLNGSSEAVSEASDGDFDFDPAFVNGRTLAADEFGDAAHLWNYSLMHPIVNKNTRMLPSMADVFSMASVNNLVSLDLDRREFWGGTNWNTAGAWAGNRLPSSDDDVFIRDPSSGPFANPIVMGLTGNGFCNNLYVGEAATVSTNAFRLLASGSTIIDGTLPRGGTVARIHVNPAGELETDNLTLVNGGKLEMFGGTADVNGALTLSDNNATIDGYGTVEVLSSLNNNGRINVSVGALLNFVGGASVVWDLDGTSESGDLVAVSGNMSFANGTVSDAFNGSMTIGANRTMTIGPVWTLGAGGIVNFTGGGAVLTGGQITVGGQINATSGASSIAASLVASGTPSIDVASGATLNVTAAYQSSTPATLTKTGAGALTFSGPQNHAIGSQLQVNGGTVTMNTDATNLAITSNANLNLNASQHLSALNVTGGRTQITAGGSRVLVTKSLTIDTTDALIDVWEHAIVVDHTGISPLASISSAIASARNGGAWNGFGITSSTASARPAHNTTLGVIESAEYLAIYGPGATFEGEAIDSTAVLVKYTYYGDTDFNELINFDDYARIDNGFNNELSGWINGDFDLNGLINFDDYALIDLAFNTQSGTLRQPNAVPEPSIFAAAVFALVAARIRRGRV